MTLGFSAVLFVFGFVTTHDPSRTSLIEPTVLLIFLTFLSHKAGLVSITVDATQIAVNPSWWDRKVFGAEPRVVIIAPGSELLFCRHLGYGALIDYKLILRTPNQPEQVLWNYPNNLFSSRRRQDISEEAHRRFGLPVRSVTQDVNEKGVVETSWTAEVEKQLWKNIRWALIPGLSPWLGIAVGLLTSDLRKIAGIGVILWMCGGTLLWLYSRIAAVRPEPKPAITLLVWTLQFIPLYIAAALASGFIRSR